MLLVCHYAMIYNKSINQSKRPTAARQPRGRRMDMTTKEKVACLESYMSDHWGETLAEDLWQRSCACIDDEELAELYDAYLA